MLVHQIFTIGGPAHMAPWITTEKFPTLVFIRSVLGNVPAFRQLGQAPKSRVHIS